MSRQMRILHIEDNDDHAELVSTAITDSRMNSRVVRFSTAESGLDYLFGLEPQGATVSRTMPDLIILDLTLPGMNGLDFLGHLRSHHQTAGIPVVVLSNSDDPNKIDAVYRRGANSYVIKPVGYDEFVIKLAEMNMYWTGTAELPDQGARLQ